MAVPQHLGPAREDSPAAERVQDGSRPPIPAIRRIDLTRRFGMLAAVDRASLEVSGGEVFGLIGPNGAGKSTMIKMLTTLLPLTSGRAWVAGFDVVDQPSLVRRRIGYVPQLLSTDGQLTG